MSVLLDLLADDELSGHVIIALGKLKAKEARPYIEPFLNQSKELGEDCGKTGPN